MGGEFSKEVFGLMMNPVGDVQTIVAELLRAQSWFADNRVEIIEQNKADLKFLLDKQIAALKNVVMIVGVDSVTNQHPELEVEVTITALEYVPLNRAGESFVTAIDAVQAAVQILDGEWWHFFNLSHDTPAERTLQATASFRGLVNRVTDAQEGE